MPGPAISLPHPAPTAGTLRLGWLLAAAGLLLHWLLALGGAPLFDIDEGAFAEASREMLASGDWGHTRLNGADRFDKPILVYWLQAASLAVLGPTELAVRLPSALCAWAWCLVLQAFASQRFGWRAGLWSAVMLATCLGPLVIGRAATADALLNLLLTLTWVDLWRHIEQGPGQAAALRRAFAWIGLGLLAKGPVAVVLPLGAGLLWAAWSGPVGWQRLRQALSDPLAWLIGLGIALPWYLYALDRHGQRFIDGFLVHHNLARFNGPLEGHGGGLGYYVLVLPLLLLPWTPLLLARRPWVQAAAEPLGRWLLCWSGFVLAFFSLSGTKLPHYLLYGLSPLVLMAARQLVTPPLPRRNLVACCAALAGLALLGALAPALLVRLADSVADPHWHSLVAAGLSGSQHGQGQLQALLIALAAGGWSAAAAVMLWRRGLRGHGAISLGLAAWLATGLWTMWAAAWTGAAVQGPVKRLALLARDQQMPLVQWRVNQPSAAFYRGRPVPQRAPDPGEWALMRADRLPHAGEGPALVVHARDGAYVLVGLAPQTPSAPHIPAAPAAPAPR